MLKPFQIFFSASIGLAAGAAAVHYGERPLAQHMLTAEINNGAIMLVMSNNKIEEAMFNNNLLNVVGGEDNLFTVFNPPKVEPPPPDVWDRFYGYGCDIKRQLDPSKP